MSNMPKSAYMALAKSIGYPVEGEGGDASLSFRIWRIARRELHLRKVRDISKFKEV